MNMLTRAKKAAAETTKKGTGPDPVPVETKGLGLLSQVLMLYKLLEAAEAALLPAIEDQMLTRFLGEGRAQNYKACETNEKSETIGTAGIEFRPRAKNQPLKEDDLTLLDATGVSHTKTPDVFQFSLDGLSVKKAKEVAMAIDNALSGIEGLPEDFLKFTAGKPVITETSIAEAFKVDDPEVRRKVLKTVGGMVITKATAPVTESEILDSVGKLIITQAKQRKA